MVEKTGQMMAGTPFVTTDWLASHIADPDIVVIDASLYLPAQQRDAKREFAEGHIPGALFFDIDAVADTGLDPRHSRRSYSETARRGH